MARTVLGSLLTFALLSGCAHRESAPDAAAPHASLSEPGSGQPATSPSNARTPEERDARHVARMDGWIAIGMGSLAGVVAIYTSYEMLHDKSVRDSNCDPQKVCSPVGFNANEELSATSGWNIGSWAFAIASLGVGAYLVLSNQDDPETTTQVGVGPTGSGAGLTVRSAFR